VVTEKLLPALQTELASLEELDTPKADTAKIEQMLQHRADSIEKIEDEGLKALFETDTLGRFVAEAEAYGLNCAE
jgi:hypothetical protein